MNNIEYSSFRDPSGYICYENNNVIRKINKVYFNEYNHLMDSGLYDELVNAGLLISHEEKSRNKNEIVLIVKKIPFISYPYEWTFDQLRDAALLTLKINKIALKYGMILKDSSSYNVQFLNGKPIFIDTLSFMFYEDNSPWGAYGQFSRHFIAPLVLMGYIDSRLNILLRDYIDGIPLDLCSSILGKKGGLISYFHIKLQNKSIMKHNLDGHSKINNVSVKKNNLINMFNMIESQINKLKIKGDFTEWDNYYDNTNYSSDSMMSKEKLVLDYCKKVKLNDNDLVFDLGANDGKFSRLVYNKYNSTVVSFDIDHNAVNRNYLNVKNNSEAILPLVLDLNNPSPGIGFSNLERKSFMDRGNTKLVMALAILHHMVISNNLSFDMVSSFFSSITKYLIIEFIPKSDSQVKILLNSRKDIFDFYDLDNFKKAFENNFKILNETRIEDSERVLFLLEVKNEKK